MNPEPSAADDLSGPSNSPETPGDAATNSLLADATARRRYRTGATCAVAGVLSILLWLLYVVVCAMTKDLAFVTPAAVSFGSALILAIAVLAIALLRSTFAPTSTSEARDSGKENGPVVTATSLEAWKAIKETVDTVFKGVTGKG